VTEDLAVLVQYPGLVRESISSVDQQCFSKIAGMYLTVRDVLVLTSTSERCQYGPVYKFFAGGTYVVVVTTPLAVSALLCNSFNAFEVTNFQMTGTILRN
jgi:hypothetical protein